MTAQTSALTAAPTLTTDRLTLRGPERGDLDPYTRFVTSHPQLAADNDTASAKDAWMGFLAGIGHWHWHGYGFFAVCTGDTIVGRVGLLNHLRWQDVELAWHLFDGHEGHGYATEAAAAIRDWARAELGIARLVSYIDTGNAPSQAVARRLGAATDGTRAAHDPDAEIWIHPKDAA